MRPPMLRTVAAARHQPEADLMILRLAEAGILAISQSTHGNPEFGASASRWIQVEEPDEQRAREILATMEPPLDDEELARLSDEAWRRARRDGADEPDA
jgi:hypothetical protein